MNTNRHEYPWTSFAATTSRDDAPPGSAGVPPAQHRHSLTPFLHPARPATAPRFRFGRAQAVSADWAARCRITEKPSGHPTQRVRSGRPRSRRGRLSHHSCPSKGHALACRAAALADTAEPSRFVALRRSSCVFVDSSFCRLFQTGRPGRRQAVGPGAIEGSDPCRHRPCGRGRWGSGSPAALPRLRSAWRWSAWSAGRCGRETGRDRRRSTRP